MKTNAELLQGLSDAGCCEAEISDFIRCCEKEDLEKGLKVLEKCRKKLLSGMHEEQRKIDTLDYVIYRVNSEKQNAERNGTL